MDKVCIVSAVRDMSMYERCLKTNPFLAGAELCPVDNKDRNESISLCYNKFLESRPVGECAWYVFCHEDFEPKEALLPLLSELDKDSLWGPIGAVTRVRCGFYHQWRLLGCIEECGKDGSRPHIVGEPAPQGTLVDTFDCQCLIVHSSLIQRHHFCFDEHLTFDLYVEDFCMAAAQDGIASRILPLFARHWSGGSVLPRYYIQEAYINAKYPNVSFTGVSSWVLGGSPSLSLRLTVAAKRAVRMVCGVFSRR